MLTKAIGILMFDGVVDEWIRGENIALFKRTKYLQSLVRV